MMNLLQAQVHDGIKFKRFGHELDGIVMKRYENSVIVRLSDESYNKIKEELPNELTVVNDKNYRIIYQANENRELA